MEVIDVGKDFSPRLANRDGEQGDGRFNAVQFRMKYLSALDNQEFWESAQDSYICFDFGGVEKISPSFANEAFAYFVQYAKPEKVAAVIIFSRISNVKRQIIQVELESGYGVSA